MQIRELARDPGLESVIQARSPRLATLRQIYSSALEVYGLEPALVSPPEVIIKPEIELHVTGAGPCDLFSVNLTTNDVDEFKSWIGIPDELILDGTLLPPDEFPAAPSKSLFGPRDPLSAAEWQNIACATNYYLFGNASQVLDYRPAISAHFSPFEMAVYAADRLEIFPGGTLRVTGYPAALVFREVVIHQGGSMKIFVPARLTAERLVVLD
jgi:hypothetical protein